MSWAKRTAGRSSARPRGASTAATTPVTITATSCWPTSGYERKLGRRLNAIVEANFRRAAKDEPLRGEEDPNTGGSVLYLSPRLLVKLDRTLFLHLGLQVPVVKDLFGDQDEKVNVLSGLTLRF